jgi:hypothetical protein
MADNSPPTLVFFVLDFSRSSNSTRAKIPLMKAKRLFSQLVFTSALAVMAAAGAGSQTAVEAPRPPARDPYSPYLDIHVDEHCRILPKISSPVSGTKKPRPFTDPAICHLESIEKSQHLEETVAGGQVLRSKVSITEQEYLLQDIASEPEIFVVEQFVPEGWVVDSDPQPVKVVGATAFFRVNAQPGEIVRLHVGLRHAKPLPPRIIKASSQSGSSGN